MVKRLGRFQSLRQPGLTYLVPLVDRMVSVDMRETPRTGDRQDVITKDNVSIHVNATIFSQVVDAQRALFAASNCFVAVDQIARTSLRSVMGSMTLDQCLSQRDAINTQLQIHMETVSDKWGIRINRVEIVDIVPPQQILQAMALQKQADQEKRAHILQSQGAQTSAINVAEGQRQAVIKQAEGEKRSQILGAEARQQALVLEAEGARQAQILEEEGGAGDRQCVWRDCRRQADLPRCSPCSSWTPWARVATSPNTKVVVPVEAGGLMGAAQALKSMMDMVPSPNGAGVK